MTTVISLPLSTLSPWEVFPQPMASIWLLQWFSCRYPPSQCVCPFNGPFDFAHFHTLLLHDKLLDFLYYVWCVSSKSSKQRTQDFRVSGRPKKIPTSFSVLSSCHGIFPVFIVVSGRLHSLRLRPWDLVVVPFCLLVPIAYLPRLWGTGYFTFSFSKIHVSSYIQSKLK